MKQSKTLLWKKSCLSSLDFDSITEWLEEIGENGDPYGYEGDEEGYYRDYKELFDDLSAGAYSMYEQLIDESYYGDYDDFRTMWNDMTVGLLGDLFTVYGYDPAELDYFRLSDPYEEEIAVKEAGKRLMRMTKEQLIRNFRKVLMTLVVFYDLKAAHDCLTSVVTELDERGALLECKNERINALYEDLTGKNGELFDQEIARLPQRMWVE